MQRSTEFKDVPVVIFCGGNGVMLGEAYPGRTNKALIDVNGLPLFLWVALAYSQHGATNFILALGYQDHLFGEALLRAGALPQKDVHNQYELKLGDQICRITLLSCGPAASTFSRLLLCKSSLDDLIGGYEDFAVAYSDTLSDIDLGSEIQFHKKNGLICTMVAAKMPVRFRVLGIRPGETLVRGFSSRPVIEAGSINGGYYLLNKKFWSESQSLDHSVAFENEPLEHLASIGQLGAYEHRGAWQTCDAERDMLEMGRIARQLSMGKK